MQRRNEETTNAGNHAEELLIDALRENLTPHAVAAIAAWLQPASTKDENVNAEIRWFTERLAQAVGGWQQQGQLIEEIGL
jgi:hypothetical protein